MKRVIFFSLMIIIMSVTAGFAGGLDVVKQTRDVRDFTNVSFGVSGKLYISFGSDFKVVLEGDKDLLEDIETTLSGKKLVIKKDNWRFSMTEKVTIYITMPALEGLSVSGSGTAEIKDDVSTNDLLLSVSGSGKLFTRDVTADQLNCRISGSGDIIIIGRGRVKNADISISGSGNYKGELCELGVADISISGSGNCICSVTGNLRARVSGSGDISYLGNPKIDARVSGSGRVRSR